MGLRGKEDEAGRQVGVAAVFFESRDAKVEAGRVTGSGHRYISAFWVELLAD